MKSLLFTVALLPVPPVFAQDFICPATPGSASTQWHSFGTDERASSVRNEGVELYAGAPQNGGQRVADDNAENIGVAPLTWTLHGRPLHMVCTYAGTPLRLSRPLPAGLTTCLANNEFEDQHVQLECR